jgi:hypothetical protein
MEGKRMEGNVGEKNWREGRRNGSEIRKEKGIGENEGERNWREWRKKELKGNVGEKNWREGKENRTGKANQKSR